MCLARRVPPMPDFGSAFEAKCPDRRLELVGECQLAHHSVHTSFTACALCSSECAMFWAHSCRRHSAQVSRHVGASRFLRHSVILGPGHTVGERHLGGARFGEMAWYWMRRSVGFPCLAKLLFVASLELAHMQLHLACSVAWLTSVVAALRPAFPYPWPLVLGACAPCSVGALWYSRLVRRGRC